MRAAYEGENPPVRKSRSHRIPTEPTRPQPCIALYHPLPPNVRNTNIAPVRYGAGVWEWAV